MAQIQVFVQLDPARASEQAAFVRSRAVVLRETGGQFWVRMDEAQLNTFISQGLVLSANLEADVLQLGPLVYRPATEIPAPPSSLRASPPAPDAQDFWIVHFVAPPDKTWQQELALDGAEQVHMLDASAGVFRMKQAAVAAVSGKDYVDSVALFQPAYAVALDLAGVDEPFNATSLATMSVHAPASDPEGNLVVRTFDGVDPTGLRPALEATGVSIVSDAFQGFSIDCGSEQLEAVLKLPGVLSVSVRMPKDYKIHNAGVIAGVNQVRDIGTVNFLINLDGTGEIGAVVDSGFDIGNLGVGFHPDLATCVRLLRNSATPNNAALAVPDNAPHGTHVAGIVAGNGASSGGVQRGMAPGAALIGLAPTPVDFRPAFNFAADNGSRVISNSWGVVHGHGRYSTTESLPLDRWCWDNPDVLLVFAAGNDESDTLGGPDGVLDARTLDEEATAKNVLSVGSCENLRNDGGYRDSWRTRFAARYNHAAFNVVAGGAAGAFSRSDNADEVALNSDRGNVRTSVGALTGRIKPDIVAPGVNVLSTRSQLVAPPALPPPPIVDPFYRTNADSMLPAGLNRNLYQISSGTSMATPVVAGAALLVRQFYRTRFAQMRRPLLLEGVAIPAAAPFPVFGAQPAVSFHSNGLVCVWITPALPGAVRNIVAMRVARQLAPVDTAPVPLQNNVGEHAAPKVATIGDRSYLLHRHSDGKLRLSCYDRTLGLVAGFGTAGVVTLAPDVRPDDAVPPDLIAVGDQLACVFPAIGGNGYFFQRFRGDTGAPVDAASSNFLSHDGTGSQRVLTWNGVRFAVCGVAHPGHFQLQVRQMDAAGALQGASPVIVVDQVPELREPCLLWDPRSARYVIVWCDARNVAGGEIWRQFLTDAAAPSGAASSVVSVPAGRHIRRPSISLHPVNGYVLCWEDDTQGAHFDSYLALLDGNAQVDATRMQVDASDATGRRLVRLSDTPGDTAGFAVVTDAAGVCVVYQSPDEVNSDRLGVYALNLTAAGAFEAQELPATPLLKSGSYVTADLVDHESVALTALSAAWAGGSYYLCRVVPNNALFDDLQWQRFNADGAVDRTFGVAGIATVPSSFLIFGVELLWTGNDRLITVVNDTIAGILLYLRDAEGAPVPTFGVGGAAALQDTVSVYDRINPQLGFFSLPSFHIVVGYGTRQAGVTRLRQQRVNARGVRVGAAANLATVDGVAAHNWFQFVNGEARSIAVYHRVSGGATRVHCRRFQLDGTPEGGERDLSAAAGEGTNGVLARRPIAVASSFREYGAVWQYRANAAAKFELRFSRLDRQGRPMANPPAPAPPLPVSDVVVIDGATAGWSPVRDAVEPQLVCTYTHERWATPPAPLPAGTSLPEWSPAYGLAFIGVEPDGRRQLYFTMLDENGRQLTVPSPPPAAGALNPPVPVGLLNLGTVGRSVLEFKLVWNGRVFLLSWAEQQGGRLYQRYTFVNRHANQNANEIPSAALLRATLVNGATNITPGPLPDLAAGYGWGRLNLRQSLAPAMPATLHVRDECAIGPGRTVRYHFVLPAGTALLRVTLHWTDPPGVRLMNRLHLAVRAPTPPAPAVRSEYRGNLWSAAPGSTHLSRPTAHPPVAADNHEDVQTFKQVVLNNPLPGEYEVEVAAAGFAVDLFNQQNLQPFALVFAGSGPEVRFNQTVAVVTGAPVY